YPAWLLNLYAFAIGLVISPRRVYQAFLRGRHSTNLYRLDFNDKLLTLNVGATRRALRLNHASPASSGLDRGTFLGWSAVSILTTLGSGAIIITPFAVILAVIALAVTGTL